MAATALAFPDPDRNIPKPFVVTDQMRDLIQEAVDAVNNPDANPVKRYDYRTGFDLAQAFASPTLRPDLRAEYVRILFNPPPVGDLPDVINTAVWDRVASDDCWACTFNNCAGCNNDSSCGCARRRHMPAVVN